VTFVVATSDEVDLLSRYAKAASHRISSVKSTVNSDKGDNDDGTEALPTASELAAQREERDRERAEKRARLRALMEQELNGVLL
jgi:hypothetical protein